MTNKEKFITAWIARDKKDSEGKKTNNAYIYFKNEPMKDDKAGYWKGIPNNDGMYIPDALFDYAVNPSWKDKRATKIMLEIHPCEDCSEYVSKENNDLYIVCSSTSILFVLWDKLNEFMTTQTHEMNLILNSNSIVLKNLSENDIEKVKEVTDEYNFTWK